MIDEIEHIVKDSKAEKQEKKNYVKVLFALDLSATEMSKTEVTRVGYFQ